MSKEKANIPCSFCGLSATGFAIHGEYATPMCPMCLEVYEAGQEHADARLIDLAEVDHWDELRVYLVETPEDPERSCSFEEEGE